MAVKQNILVFCVIAVAYIVYDANGLSCVKCDDKPCEIPACCESGNYVHDVCGCCPVCARAPGKRCGGPWGISGTCSKDLACFRSCECATLPSAADDQKHKCIFPFKYQEITYNGCTTNHSDNGDRWCAFEVDEAGVVLDGKWGDCNDACPHDGEGEEGSGGAPSCDESSLFNIDGTCVDAAMETSLDRAAVGYAFKFDAGATVTEPAPVCKTEGEANKCKCATSISGEPVGQKAGCTQTADSTEGQPPSYGWCFLENIEDPTDATKNCFPDTLWSETHGRFWSHRACIPEGGVTEPPPLGKVEETTLAPEEDAAASS